MNNYNMRFNFEEYNDRVQSFLNSLVNNSYATFKKQIKDGKILKGHKQPIEKDTKYQIEESNMKFFIRNVEEFLHYYYVNDKRSFYNVLSAVQKLKAISVLDDKDRGAFGVTLNYDTILINPDLKKSSLLTSRLTSSQRKRLYVFHELGHMVNKAWLDELGIILDGQPGMPPQSKDLFMDGFRLLDEATTQDRAEQMAYYYAKTERPMLYYSKDQNNEMYGGKVYKTNFDYYGELEPIAIEFGRTLKGIGKISDDREAMSTLSKRALKRSFANDIIKEYTKDQQIPYLLSLMRYMGMLKRASYARFGRGDKKCLKDSLNIKNSFSKMASEIRDFGDPVDIIYE